MESLTGNKYNFQLGLLVSLNLARPPEPIFLGTSAPDLIGPGIIGAHNPIESSIRYNYPCGAGMGRGVMEEENLFQICLNH